MLSVSSRWDLLLRGRMVSVGIIAAVPFVVWLAMSLGTLPLVAVVGLIALIVGAYVGIRHPLWLYWGLAAVMAGLQFGRIPGVNLPLYLPLAFGALVAAFFHPRFARSMHPLELAVLALAIASAVSVVAMGHSLADVSLFIRWAIATLMMIALVRLSPEHLARFGCIFVYVAALNAVFGLYIIAFDPNHTSFRYLRIFGYTPEATVARFAYTDEGSSRSVRLGGTWVEPNGAGLNLLIALVLCILLFAGWRRVVLAALLTSALALTLSRSAIFSVVVGVILVLIFHSMRSRDRIATIGTMSLVAAAAFLISPIRRRILTSFRSDDAGSTSRMEALHNFPDQMSGHWGFGVGWARPEFVDPAYAYVLNLPSNAPLIALYRGGIFVGIAFLAVMVLGCVVGYRALRSESLPFAIYGGVFIGLCFVQFQLDHNVADVPQGALLYSIVLAFLVYVDRARRAAMRQTSTETYTPAATKVLAGSR
jgi:hypothetical protein